MTTGLPLTYKLVAETIPPMYTFPPIPTPPVTTNAPDVELKAVAVLEIKIA